MLVSSWRRPNLPRLASHVSLKFSIARNYATHQKHLGTDIHGTPPKPKRPAHVGPRDWRRTQKLVAAQDQLPQGDSPEIRISKTRLFNLTNTTKINLDSVDQIAADCGILHQEKIPLSSATIQQALKWCTRALIHTNGLLARSKSPSQQIAISVRQWQSTLQKVVEGFVAQYKQGVYAANNNIPATVLSYYRKVGDFEKALKLWNWLCSVGERGHQGWQTYAERISIADSMDEGYDSCQALFDEALDKLGDPLVVYHVSDNASLPSTSQPAPKEALHVIPLLNNMLSIRLEHGRWREALLTLDTILRLDPMRLRKSTTSRILAKHTSWEAFLTESVEVESGDVNSSRSSVVVPWLAQLVDHSRLHPYNSKTASRLHSIACALLELLRMRHQAHLISIKGRNVGLDSGPHNGDFTDLKLLWTCWSTLYHLHGRDTDQPQNELAPASSMAGFIAHMLEELRCQGSASFQAYIGHDINAIAKSEGNPEMRQTTSGYLSDLRQRVDQIMSPEGSTTTTSDQMFSIPYWSDLFSRDEMFALYQELGYDREIATADQASTSSPAEFVYETKTGLSFAEARFRSWWMINLLYLAADAFEQADCLYPYYLEQETKAETAAKQADVLEMLNLKNSSGEERTRQKQMLLEYLKDFRRYRGDAAM